MKISTEKITPLQWQILVWCVIFLAVFLSFLAMDGFLQSLVYAVLSILFYAIIIYGNISLLYPRLYEKQHTGLYIAAAIFLIAGAGTARAYISQIVYNRYFAMSKPYPLTLRNILYVCFACIVVFILSFIFRIALDWFQLRQQARQMSAQKSAAELNLLKSQVQPHFLFNTLNNIYYEAFRESPRTALLIGRLSEIMRYFVDESPKDRLPIATEIAFLENYIALEKIRLRHEVDIAFHIDFNTAAAIPPMLLMTFVENIFKHGIDRSAPGNKVSLSLIQNENMLIFHTENPILPLPASAPAAGFGIRNLQKRLTLLYGNNFLLRTSRSGDSFLAHLEIPLERAASQTTEP